jgi:hypothetical protein
VTPEEVLAAEWAAEQTESVRPSPLRAVALAVIALDAQHRADSELGAAVRRVLAVYWAGGPS